ncbi:MAG: hypothetical protein AAFO63_01620 [Pseudomonadota bacterium]
MFRLATSAAMLGLGIWLSYEAIRPVILIVDRGSPVYDALMQPPTSMIRIIGAGLMSIGGVLALLSKPGGGTVATIGAFTILGMSGLIAATGADASLWLNTFLYGVGAVLLAILLLTLRRT